MKSHMIRKHITATVLSLGLLAIAACTAAAEPATAGQPPPATNLLQAKPEAVAAWKDMRFGMFICWGPLTLTGEEIGWSRGEPTPVEDYDNLVK